MINIPPRYREGLKTVGELDDAAFSQLYGALKECPAGSLNERDLTSKIAGSIPSLDAEKIERVLRALTSLYQLIGRRHVTPDNMSTQISEAAQTEQSGLVPAERAPLFRKRVAELLCLNSLNVLSTKAKELRLDVERTLCDVRILTDMRPIFGNEVHGTPAAVVILHTLRIIYHEGPKGVDKEIYIAIDEDDIHQLRAILDRAEAKAKSLESSLAVAGIRSVDLE